VTADGKMSLTLSRGKISKEPKPQPNQAIEKVLDNHLRIRYSLQTKGMAV
jgi:hypothetical protein